MKDRYHVHDMVDLRNWLGLSLRGMAKILSSHKDNVHRWERMKRVPNPQVYQVYLALRQAMDRGLDPASIVRKMEQGISTVLLSAFRIRTGVCQCIQGTEFEPTDKSRCPIHGVGL